MKKTCSIATLLAVTCIIFVSVLGAAEPGSFFTDGPRDKKEMSLTFDDGPGNFTPKVLEVLANYNIKATFFMEGDQVEFRKKIAKMVFDAGHEVGGHSYSHPDFYHYKKEDYRQLLSSEIDKAGKLIEGATGKKPHIMRMPYGYIKPWVKEVAKEKGYVLVNWSFGCDWKKMTGEQLAQAYIKHIGPGAIFLMHDGGKGRGPTVEALPRIIEEIQKRGYKIVPVGEMLGLNESK